MGKIIQREKSVIPACDMRVAQYIDLVVNTAEVEGIGGYKVGFFLGLGYGLDRVVGVTREITDKPIIYDHQKGGTDIPDTGKNFAKVCKEAGVDAIILFPQSGPETERAWIEAAFEQDLGVIVGGLMTHPKYVRSEGGYISNEAILEMYNLAAALGVKDFVVPGNRPRDIREIKSMLENKVGIEPTFYAPGFIKQGGEISDTARVAGDNWHAIVGRGIYEAQDMKQAAIDLTSKL